MECEVDSQCYCNDCDAACIAIAAIIGLMLKLLSSIPVAETLAPSWQTQKHWHQTSGGPQ